MKDKLDYYRSLSFEQLLELPMEQYREYLSLLVQASNDSFHKSLENEKSRKRCIVFQGVILNALTDERAYSWLCSLPLTRLVEEYYCLKSCHDLYFCGSDELVYSPVQEYLDGLSMIMEAVIAERVCACFISPDQSGGSVGFRLCRSNATADQPDV